MAWLTIRGAAQALRCSERTIHRRMHTGRLEANRDNGTVLVQVPDDLTDTVSETVGHLSQVSTSAAVERVKANETVGLLTRELSEVRKLYADTMLREHRASVRARTATVVCLMLLGGLGIFYHQETRRLDNRVSDLDGQVSAMTRERDGAVARASVADRRATEAIEDRDQVLDAHLAGFGFQVADAGR